MIDKKRLTVVVAAVVVVIAALIVALIWALNRGSSNTGQGQPTTDSSPIAAATPTVASNSPSQSTSPSTSDTEASGDLQNNASNAALNVANWDGGDTTGQRQLVYKQAGLTPKLAKSFVPVWSKIFATKRVMHTKGADGLPIISASVTNQADQTTVTKVSGTSGHHQFTYSVQLDYTATWDQKTGSDDYQQTGTYTYYVTVDEATKKTIAIQQPTTTDIALRLK